jgi:hypothetical protein
LYFSLEILPPAQRRASSHFFSSELSRLKWARDLGSDNGRAPPCNHFHAAHIWLFCRDLSLLIGLLKAGSKPHVLNIAAGANFQVKRQAGCRRYVLEISYLELEKACCESVGSPTVDIYLPFVGIFDANQPDFIISEKV